MANEMTAGRSALGGDASVGSARKRFTGARALPGGSTGQTDCFAGRQAVAATIAAQRRIVWRRLNHQIAGDLAREAFIRASLEAKLLD